VRFIFAWPRDTYLSVFLPARTLSRQLPGDLDLGGWDLRMALHQFAKSNGSFLEWLGSPLVYACDARFGDAVTRLCSAYFQPKPVIDHYLGLAKSMRAKAGDGPTLNGKMALYVLRATLAARWTLEHRAAPPVPFAGLLAGLAQSDLRGEIDALVAAKSAGLEEDDFPVSEALRNFIDSERAAVEAAVSDLTTTRPDPGPLDALLRRTLDRLEPGTGLR
jgi:predicted nucleotidyltransferase